MSRKYLYLIGILAGVVFVSPSLRADEQQEKDEKLLRQAGIGTEWDSLRAFLRSPSEAAANPERVQRLVRQLGSNDFQEREQASRELKACGWPALEPLRKALQSPDAEVVRRAQACIKEVEAHTDGRVYDAAMRRLARLRHAEAVLVLLDTLDHPDALARKHAYGELCQTVGPRDLQEVVKATKDKRPYVRAGAIGLSYKFKDQPKVFTPILLEALRDESAPVRRMAAGISWHFGSEEGMVPALIAALKDPDVAPKSEPSVASSAARVLGGLGARARPAVPALMELSRTGHERHRYSATLALGRLAAKDEAVVPTIVPFFVQIMEDKEQPIRDRAEAARALGVIGPNAKGAVPALRKALQLGFGIVALGRIGPAAEAAVPDLAAILQDKTRKPGTRASAAEALGNIGPAAKSAVPALVEALKDQELQVKEEVQLKKAAAKALRAMGPAAGPAVPALTEALKDGLPWFKHVAAETLVAVGPAAKPAVPALTEALKDRSPTLRKTAAKALGTIGPAAEPAVPALAGALKDVEPEVREAAAGALGAIGPVARSAVPALTEAQKDGEPPVRQAAAEALKRVQSKPE